jgi:uncharacterized membrane protein YkvI
MVKNVLSITYTYARSVLGPRYAVIFTLGDRIACSGDKVGTLRQGCIHTYIIFLIIKSLIPLEKDTKRCLIQTDSEVYNNCKCFT